MKPLFLGGGVRQGVRFTSHNGVFFVTFYLDQPSSLGCSNPHQDAINHHLVTTRHDMRYILFGTPGITFVTTLQMATSRCVLSMLGFHNSKVIWLFSISQEGGIGHRVSFVTLVFSQHHQRGGGLANGKSPSFWGWRWLNLHPFFFVMFIQGDMTQTSKKGPADVQTDLSDSCRSCVRGCTRHISTLEVVYVQPIYHTIPFWWWPFRCIVVWTGGYWLFSFYFFKRNLVVGAMSWRFSTLAAFRRPELRCVRTMAVWKILPLDGDVVVIRHDKETTESLKKWCLQNFLRVSFCGFHINCLQTSCQTLGVAPWVWGKKPGES